MRFGQGWRPGALPLRSPAKPTGKSRSRLTNGVTKDGLGWKTLSATGNNSGALPAATLNGRTATPEGSAWQRGFSARSASSARRRSITKPRRPPAVECPHALNPPPQKTNFPQLCPKVLTSHIKLVKLLANAEICRQPLLLPPLLRLYLSAQIGGGLSLCVQRVTTDIPAPAGFATPGGFCFCIASGSAIPGIGTPPKLARTIRKNRRQNSRRPR